MYQNHKAMKVRVIIYILLVLSFNKLSAQTEKELKKTSFIIHCDASVNKQKYEDAADNYGQLDQFRFYDKRRIVKFKNVNVSIELYSAKELLDKYKKLISPLTIKAGQKYKDVWFVLSENENNLIPKYE